MDELRLLDLDGDSISLMPSTLTNIQLKKQVYVRKEAPFPSKCTDRYILKAEELDLNDLFRYSDSYCMNFCRATYVHNKCGCWALFLLPPMVKLEPIKPFVKWTLTSQTNWIPDIADSVRKILFILLGDFLCGFSTCSGYSESPTIT